MNLDNKLLFERYDFKQKFITEGGAAGHMAHPYDLPDVTNFDETTIIPGTMSNG